MVTNIFIPELKNLTHAQFLQTELSKISNIHLKSIDYNNHMITIEYTSQKSKDEIKNCLYKIGFPSICNQNHVLKSARTLGYTTSRLSF